MKNKYSGFLDLVAVKSKAMISGREYENMVKLFVSSLEKLADNHNVDVYVFSDSAYFSCEDEQIFNFLNELRMTLAIEDIYFTCSLCKKNLSIMRIGKTNKSRVKGIAFYSAETVRAYVMQANLKGIGISAENEIVQEYNSSFINSFYIDNINNINVYPFSDLRYEFDSIDSAIKIVKNILSNVVSLYYINKNATRYYFSIFISVINSYFYKEEIDNEDYYAVVSIFDFITKSNYNEIILYMFAFLVEKGVKDLEYDDCLFNERIIRISDSSMFELLAINMDKVSFDILSYKSRNGIADWFRPKFNNIK